MIACPDPTYWLLPGPDRFLRGLDEDVRDGRNVVLELADGQEALICGVVPDRLRRDGYDVLEVVWDAKEKPTSRTLSTALLGETAAHDVSGFAGLVAHRGAAGKVVWIVGPRAEQFAGWMPCLLEFEHACRQRPPWQRPCLIMAVSGRLANPPREVALVSRQLAGTVGRIDVLARLSFKQTRAPNVIARAAWSVIAELAQYDLRLVDELAIVEPARLESPMALLSDLARSRGLCKPATGEAAWRAGFEGEWEGRPAEHSFALALRGDASGLERRVWHGQLRECFPLIEEARVRLIEEVRRYLTPPPPIAYESSETILDLEIGNVFGQLVQSRAPHQYIERARHLRHLRNRLAHLEAVRFSDLRGL